MTMHGRGLARQHQLWGSPHFLLQHIAALKWDSLLFIQDVPSILPKPCVRAVLCLCGFRCIDDTLFRHAGANLVVQYEAPASHEPPNTLAHG